MHSTRCRSRTRRLRPLRIRLQKIAGAKDSTYLDWTPALSRSLSKVPSRVAGLSTICPLLVPEPGGIFPPVQTVIRHALIRERKTLVEDSALLRTGENIEANLLMVAGIIDFVEFVPGAEFRADGVPDQLEELDALSGGGGHAAIISFQERREIGVLEIFVAGRGHQQAAAQKLLEDVAHGGPALRAEEPHGVRVLLPGHHRSARRALRVHAHGRRHSPDQISPAMISPSAACTPRNAPVPFVSMPLAKRP